MTHILEKKFSKNIYDRRRVALSKASNSSFSDGPCYSSFKFFDVATSNLKTAIFNLSEFVYYDIIMSKEAKKCNYKSPSTEKKRYIEPSIRHKIW